MTTGPRKGTIEVLICLTLLGAYGYFWSPRGWNNGTRLMLTYALGDRGTVRIDGMEEITRDRAFVNGHFYCDKPPGQSWLGLPMYLLVKSVTGVSHPTHQPAQLHWWVDWFVTLWGSGLPTALVGVMLYRMGRAWGCDPWLAAVTGLSYGIASPAFPYGALFHGHMAAGSLGLAACLTIWNCARQRNWDPRVTFLAGLFAGGTVLIEYTQVFLSLGLFVWILFQARPWKSVLTFVLGASLCAGAMAGYNFVAFGSPLQIGYFHETEPEFAAIYSAKNPLGLITPNPITALKILFSSHGLLWYAPAVILAPLGLWELWRRGERMICGMICLSFGSLWIINAAHPTWVGGWATGPRYVHASLPLVYLAVLFSLQIHSSVRRWVLFLTTLCGFVVCLGSISWEWGGLLPDYGYQGGDYPILKVILPAYAKGIVGNWNLGNYLLHGAWEDRRPKNWLAWTPLLGFLAVMVWGIYRSTVRIVTTSTSETK